MNRARLTLCTILAVGGLLTAGTTVGLAQSGLDTGSNADAQQYGKSDAAPSTTQRPTSDVLGEVGEVEEQPSSAAPAPTAQAAPTAAAAPTNQGGELPFTGFAVVTSLLLGIALLGMGMVLRRNTRRGTKST